MKTGCKFVIVLAAGACALLEVAAEDRGGREVRRYDRRIEFGSTPFSDERPGQESHRRRREAGDRRLDASESLRGRSAGVPSRPPPVRREERVSRNWILPPSAFGEDDESRADRIVNRLLLGAEEEQPSGWGWLADEVAAGRRRREADLEEDEESLTAYDLYDLRRQGDSRRGYDSREYEAAEEGRQRGSPQGLNFFLAGAEPARDSEEARESGGRFGTAERFTNWVRRAEPVLPVTMREERETDEDYSGYQEASGLPMTARLLNSGGWSSPDEGQPPAGAASWASPDVETRFSWREQVGRYRSPELKAGDHGGFLQRHTELNAAHEGSALRDSGSSFRPVQSSSQWEPAGGSPFAGSGSRESAAGFGAGYSPYNRQSAAPSAFRPAGSSMGRAGGGAGDLESGEQSAVWATERRRSSLGSDLPKIIPDF